jgi:hypothetical protein
MRVRIFLTRWVWKESVSIRKGTMRFKEDILQNYLDTAVERHRIYLKKEAGASKPWTNDPVYQQFFFCNLFRQYDKCSKWIIDNIVPLNRWDLIILYRFISTYELFESIKANCPLDDLVEIEKYLKARKELGAMFNGCFLRNPRIEGGWVETYRVPYFTIRSMKAKGWTEDGGDLQHLPWETLEDLVTELRSYPGIGGFMGYEYACDLEYTEHFNPTDKFTWANMGPGAMKGMSLLLYGVQGKKMSQSEWLMHAQELFKHLQGRMLKEFPNEVVTMREVEHWLCEYQKYRKYWGVLNHGHKVKFRTYGGMS